MERSTAQLLDDVISLGPMISWESSRNFYVTLDKALANRFFKLQDSG